MAGINPYLLGRTRYRVVAPCVVATSVNGRDTYVYRHGFLPLATRPSQVESMLSNGMIEKVEASA